MMSPTKKNKLGKCFNFELCGNFLYYQFEINHLKGLCVMCNVMFGTWHGIRHNGKRLDMDGNPKLVILESAYCPICLQTKRSVIQPCCIHSLCIDCFKICHFKKVIPFPLKDKEKYYKNFFKNYKYFQLTKPKNIDFTDNEWRKIQNWIIEYKINDTKVISKNMRRCPICRAKNDCFA